MSSFREEPRGVLVAVDYGQPSPSYSIWFDYTRNFVNSIREGDLVAVRSFVSGNDAEVFSILELSAVMPVHYALGSSASDVERAYPGFVVEAARSARQDWEQERPEEESTKIKCTALPTGIQIRFDSNGTPTIEDDVSLPMVGEEAHLLTNELMEQVVNRGIGASNVPVISSGQLALNPEVEVLLKVEDLLRTHFGIFGFTGAGKSNLVSTIVTELAALQGVAVKIVLFDLMSEYHSLFADLLHSHENTLVVSLDQDSIPGGEATLEYYRTGTDSSLEEAARAVARVALLPAELNPLRPDFERCFRRSLELNKFRVLYTADTPPTGQELRGLLQGCLRGNLGNARPHIEAWIDNVTRRERITLNEIRSLVGQLDEFVRNRRFPSRETQPGLLEQETSVSLIEMSDTARNAVSCMADALRGYIPSDERRPPERARLLENDLIQQLCADDGRSAVYIIQSDNDDNLRSFSARLVNRIFHIRRRQGINRPLVLFIYDEADEFIPQDASGESYAQSSNAAEILARRGRKFGMGLAISTQRVAYLNTKILGQPHTYFVSKLPRKYDRDVMTQAFGIADDVLNRALKFTRGQWLLVSYEASGLQNVPIPVRFPNANSRIRQHLAQADSETEIEASSQ